jgi:hypothetical protein
MKIVQTFWTGNKAGNDTPDFDIKGGWPTSEYHWISWALSCLQAVSLFDEVELITDDLGKEILINKLKLPYTSVSTKLNTILHSYPLQVWALAKIFSYSIQTKPFLHIDGDVFLFKKPNEKILKAGIISQNLEKDLFFYKDALDEVNQHFTDIPEIYQKSNYENKTIYSANAGLIGGSDLDFFKIYCEAAFEFINNNKQSLSKIETKKLPLLNFLFEQYAFYQIAKGENKVIDFYWEEIIETPVYENFICFQDHPFVKMVHPVGGFKMQRHLCDHLIKHLRSRYPIFYYRVIEFVRDENLKMANNIYYCPLLEIPELPVRLYTSSEFENPHRSYELTLEAMEFFSVSENFPDADSLWEISEEDFKNRLRVNFNNDSKSDMLNEVFQLESRKNRLFHNIFNNSEALTSEYKKDKNLYDHIQQIFSLNRTELLEENLTLNKNVLLMEAGWIWRYMHKDDIKDVIRDNAGKDKSFHQLALIPNIVRACIDEYYPDQLDMIIMEIAEGDLKINDIINAAKEYFDAEEIGANKDNFEKLILDTLKRLTYSGMLTTLSKELQSL